MKKIKYMNFVQLATDATEAILKKIRQGKTCQAILPLMEQTPPEVIQPPSGLDLPKIQKPIRNRLPIERKERAMRPKLYANTTGSSKADRERDYKHQEPRRQYGYEIRTINQKSLEQRNRRKRRESLAAARGS